MKTLAAFCLGRAVFTACGAEARDRSTTEPENGEQKYRGTGLVLHNKERAPELCLGVVMESLPPQCSGPPIVDWDWNEVADEESAGNVTWGTYEVVGY